MRCQFGGGVPTLVGWPRSGQRESTMRAKRSGLIASVGLALSIMLGTAEAGATTVTGGFVTVDMTIFYFPSVVPTDGVLSLLSLKGTTSFENQQDPNSPFTNTIGPLSAGQNSDPGWSSCTGSSCPTPARSPNDVVPPYISFTG